MLELLRLTIFRDSFEEKDMAAKTGHFFLALFCLVVVMSLLSSSSAAKRKSSSRTSSSLALATRARVGRVLVNPLANMKPRKSRKDRKQDKILKKLRKRFDKGCPECCYVNLLVSCRLACSQLCGKSYNKYAKAFFPLLG